MNIQQNTHHLVGQIENLEFKIQALEDSILEGEYLLAELDEDTTGIGKQIREKRRWVKRYTKKLERLKKSNAEVLPNG